jgi:FkbM family methyltransferase
VAASVDLEFLHTLAVDAEDRRVLDRVAADRRTLLAGGVLPEPGEPLRLKLDIDECLHQGRLRRGHPGTPLVLTLRSDLAPASLDTIIEIFRDGVHTRADGFREAETLVDLGANEGFYTLFMKRLNPGLRALAVEPVAENAALFRGNIAANGVDGVTLVQAAVTDRAGEVAIEVYPHVGSVASTDLKAFPRPWIDDTRIRRRVVPSSTLAGLMQLYGLEGADILKMDVEGSEDRICSTEPEVLRRFDRIVVECHGVEVRERCTAALKSAGFRVVREERKRSGEVYAVRAAPWAPRNLD